MKRVSTVSLAIIICLLFLCGCSQDMCDTASCRVYLCNFEGIALHPDVYMVSKDELNAVLSIQLSLLGAEDFTNSDITVLTDETAQNYYGEKSASLVIENLLTTIIERRVYEEVYSYILEHSSIEDAGYGDEFVDSIVQEHQTAAAKAGLGFKTYLEKYYQTDEAAMRQTLYNAYFEFQCVMAIVDQKNIVINNEERNVLIHTIAEEDGISEAEVIPVYGYEYIDFLIASEKIKAMIIFMYADAIDSAVNIARANLS